MTTTICPKCRNIHYCGPPDYGFHRCQYCGHVWPDRMPRIIRMAKLLAIIVSLIIVLLLFSRLLAP